MGFLIRHLRIRNDKRLYINGKRGRAALDFGFRIGDFGFASARPRFPGSSRDLVIPTIEKNLMPVRKANQNTILLYLSFSANPSMYLHLQEGHQLHKMKVVIVAFFL